MSKNNQDYKINYKKNHLHLQGQAEYFTGTVNLEMLFDAYEDTNNTVGALVSFNKGARTAWHSHPKGQTLVVVSGKGLVQSWGGEIKEINVGDVIVFPAGLKHWHGATADNEMTHMAITPVVEGTNAVWLEKVSDEEYSKYLKK